MFCCTPDIQINLLKSSTYFTYHVTLSQILHVAQIALMCLVQLSNETATFALYNISRLILYNLGDECLLRGTQSLHIKHTCLVFKELRVAFSYSNTSWGFFFQKFSHVI